MDGQLGGESAVQMYKNSLIIRCALTSIHLNIKRRSRVKVILFTIRFHTHFIEDN